MDYVNGYTHDGEFVLVAEDGANDLKDYPVQYVAGKIWVNNHAHVLQGISNVAENYFLKLSISNSNVARVLVGGGRAKLNADTMMDLRISISKTFSEQAKIGSFFRGLDELIALHQRKQFFYFSLIRIANALLCLRPYFPILELCVDMFFA